MMFKQRKIATTLITLLVSCMSAWSQRTIPDASAYLGQWQVGQVLINGRRMDRLPYQYNDPQLVGRFITIDTHRIETDLPEISDCKQLGFMPHQSGLNTLLEQTLLPVFPGHDAVRDFGLKSIGRGKVRFVWLSCSIGFFGPSLVGTRSDAQSKHTNRTWLLPLPNNQLLTRWYGDTLLVLKRVKPNAITRPSFACTQARLPAEKAICASPNLASYDTSLAKAWAFTVKFCEKEAACLQRMRQEQKTWVAQRNHCGRDSDCLGKAMRDRLYVLMHPED